MSYHSIPTATSASAPLMPTSRDENAVEIEFDREAGYNYTCLVPSIVLPFLAPLFALVARKNMEVQKCAVTDRRVVFETGWLDHSNKSIPLDRIQDVNVRQDCVQKCFGVHTIEIQTAGMGGGIEPEAKLIAPVNAMMVRDMIMDRRDALVLGNQEMLQSAARDMKPHFSQGGGGGDGLSGAVVEELRSIKDTLVRLETQVSSGFDHLTRQS